MNFRDTNTQLIATAALSLGLLAPVSDVSAHTTFRQPPSPAFKSGSTVVTPTGIVENNKDYDWVQNSHGCFLDNSFEKLKRAGVMGTSVVFPTDPDSSVVTFPSSANTPSGFGNPFATDGSQNLKGTADSLSNYFTWKDHTGKPAPLTSISQILTVMPYVGVFPKWVKKYDASGQVAGFATYGSRQDPSSTLAYPVSLGAISFKPTSCAQKLVIRVAIADICKNKTFPPTAPTALVWINHTTAKFRNSDVDGIAPVSYASASATQPTTNPANFWPTVTIKRDLVGNPLPASCNGQGLDVFDTPTDTQIDRDLPIKGWWGR